MNRWTYIENEEDPWEGNRNVSTTMHAEKGKNKEGTIDRRTNERRRVGLVEGGKDKFVDFGREVLPDGEFGKQISRPKDMSGQM